MEKEKVENLNEGIPQKDLGDLNEKNNAMVSSLHSHNLMKDNPDDDASPKLYAFDCPEVVSKEIINLAISLAITENYKQQISKLIPNFCCNYVLESFKNFLLQGSISYDKCKEEEDEEGVDNNNSTNSNYLFYNNTYTDMNTWKEIKEPSKPLIARDASTLIKPVKATEEDENKYDPKRNNALLEISQTDNSVKEEKHHSKKVSKFKMRNKFELISNPKEDGDQSLRTLKKGLNPSLLNTSNNKNIKTKGGDGNTTIRERNDGKDRNKVIEIETHYLPTKVFFNGKFPEELLNEFETLRKNQIIETAKKQEEERLRKEQENKELMLAMAARNAKEIDTQRITFDSNGNIIPLKFPRIEALGHEFWWSKQIIKEISVFPTEIPKAKPSSSPQNKDKRGNQIKSIGIVDEKKNKIRDRNSSKMLNPYKEESNISYNVDINELFKNRNSKNSKPNIPIIPSGSNMNLINPEIGVIISDERQKKEGSMEFSLKFNKFSMEEFSRIALESMNNNTAKNLMSSANSNFNDESNPYIGYAEKFHSSNNPLIQNAHASKNSDYNRSEIPKNRFMTSENPLMPNARILFKSQNLERINLSNQLQTNLKAAIELVEETGFNQSMMNPDIKKRNTEIPKNTDIIKENQLREGSHYKQPEPLDLNMIDSFNSNIIKSKDWGSSNISPFQSVFHRRPVKSNHIRELGLKIVSTKLPRDRQLVSAQRINSIR